MPDERVVIIGAGIGGLAAGCHAQMNGFRTTILEAHGLPGGMCTAWKREGYTFDYSIRHLAGCRPGNLLQGMWEELGAMPRDMLFPEDLTQGDRAVCVRTDKGDELAADAVISNAFGYTTIHKLLDEEYIDDKTSARFARPDDKMTMGIHVSLGVNRDLSREPSSLVLLRDNPVILADQTLDRIPVRLYGFDPSLAPSGKSVIKLLLNTSYAYWKNLAEDRIRYDEAKGKLLEDAIAALEPRFPGLGRQIEVTDIATPVTNERYTGNGKHPFWCDADGSSDHPSGAQQSVDHRPIGGRRGAAWLRRRGEDRRARFMPADRYSVRRSGRLRKQRSCHESTDDDGSRRSERRRLVRRPGLRWNPLLRAG